MSKRIETRREFLRMAMGGGFAAAVLARCGGAVLDTAAGTSTATDGGTTTTTGTASDAGTGAVDCVLDPTTTKGPYWVDERLERADVRSDTNGRASPNPRPGLPLALDIAVNAYSGGACTPLSGAQVDIWHCDASETRAMRGTTSTATRPCSSPA